MVFEFSQVSLNTVYTSDIWMVKRLLNNFCAFQKKSLILSWAHDILILSLVSFFKRYCICFVATTTGALMQEYTQRYKDQP